MKINIKRAYDKPDKSDGTRILVDRLWPRGRSKEDLKLGLWLKEIAPSDELRKWYSHDPERWAEFKAHYFEELDGKADVVDQLLGQVKKGAVTLVFSAKEERYNNAVALKEYIERHARKVPRAA
jgi:uncharacterized protein YeaO (DUF488 family)